MYERKIGKLFTADNNCVYKLLPEPETMTTESNKLYNYFNEF